MKKRIFAIIISLILTVSILSSCMTIVTPAENGTQAQKTDVTNPTENGKATKAPEMKTVPNVAGEIVGESTKSGTDLSDYSSAYSKRSEAAAYKDEAAPGEYDYSKGIYPSPETPTGGAFYDGYDGDGTLISGQEGVAYKAGQLTGAELNDTKYYDEFLKESNENNWFEVIGSFSTYANNRVVIKTYTKLSEEPLYAETLANVKVELYSEDDTLLYTAVSNKQGTAYLYYGVFGEKCTPSYVVCTAPDGEVEKSELITSEESKQFGQEVYFACNKKITKLDLMFMIDTTGSMGDELKYLKAEIADIITRSTQDANISVRTSVNFYRDTTDEYIVRYYPFETDTATVKNQISQQSARGGGDTPEAVHTALENAVNTHAWDEDSVKLLFFVLDAPPHKGDEVYKSLKESIIKAAAMGIRIIPVVSSGSDDLTEYLMRTYALLTGGTYTFLTDHSGIGNSHAEPTTDVQYEIEYLNDMIVRIIDEYVNIEASIIE